MRSRRKQQLEEQAEKAAAKAARLRAEADKQEEKADRLRIDALTLKEEVVLLEGGPRGGETVAVPEPHHTPFHVPIYDGKAGLVTSMKTAVYVKDEENPGVWRFSQRRSRGVKDENPERPEATLLLKDHDIYTATRDAALATPGNVLEKIVDTFHTATEKSYIENGRPPKVLYLTLEIESS